MEAMGAGGLIPTRTEALGVWGYTPVVSAPERYRQDCREFKDSFSFGESLGRPGPQETLSPKQVKE